MNFYTWKIRSTNSFRSVWEWFVDNRLKSHGLSLITPRTDDQEASKSIRMKVIDLGCASTLFQPRHVCPTSALGIPPSVTLPSYLKLFTITSHRYAFMLARLTVLPIAELRGQFAKISFSDYLLLFHDQWTAPTALWITCVLSRYQLPFESWVVSLLLANFDPKLTVAKYLTIVISLKCC